MERVLTQEERIRRAEEIYLRRRNLQQPQYRVQTREQATNRTSPARSIGLFKRMALQIIICLLLYCIFYLIYDTNFSFSSMTITKTQEILNYDINVEELYNNVNSYINGLIVHNNDEQTEVIEENTSNSDEVNSQDNEQQQNIENSETENKAVEEEPVQEDITQQVVPEQTEQTEQTSTEEVSLKQVYALIRPINGGYISSEFGERESTSEVVSTNHKGIDIAISERNKYSCSNRRYCNNGYLIQ